jgi:hypothetical protein
MTPNDDQEQGKSRGGSGGPGNKSPSTKGTTSDPSPVKPKGTIADLVDYMFDHGTKGSADQLKTSWEQVVNYVTIHHGPDIGTKLLNREPLEIPVPEYNQEDVERHEAEQLLRKEAMADHIKDYEAHIEQLLTSPFPNAIQISNLKFQIRKMTIELNKPVPYTPTGRLKDAHLSGLKTYNSRIQALDENRGKAYAIIFGQCTLSLKAKMEYDPKWSTIAKSPTDPLALFNLIEKTILAHSEPTDLRMHSQR